MSAIEFDKPSLLQRIVPLFRGFDFLLLLFIAMLAGAGLLAMYSAGFDHGTRFVDHGRNMLIAAGLLFVLAQISPAIDEGGCAAVHPGRGAAGGGGLVRHHQEGATRWVNVGVVIQPSGF